MASRVRLPRSVRRLVAVLVVVALVEFFVLPQVAGARRSARLLANVNPVLIGVAVLLEVAALAAYFQLTRSLLPVDDRPRFGRVARIELATLGLSHVVPGGSGPASALGFRLLTEAGVRPADAGFALAAQGLGSAVVLNVLLWGALLVSIPARGFQPLYTTAAIVGVVLLGAFAVLVVGLTRGEQRTADVLSRVAARLPFLDGDKVDQGVRRIAGRLRQLAADRRLLARATAWASANWLLDAASLWVFVAAFGYQVGIDSLLVAYGVANVLAALPITPGGLGIVEGVLTPTLIGFGVPAGVAVLGVIGWRLINFWLPIPAGGLAYLSLRLGRGERRGRRAEELARMIEEARTTAVSPRQWATRTGLRVGRAGVKERPPE